MEPRCPDAIDQIYHLTGGGGAKKACLPQKDLARIKGVTNMDEVWRRLDRIYGDLELNKLTIRSNLSKLLVHGPPFQQVQELHQGVLQALTQLQMLGRGG